MKYCEHFAVKCVFITLKVGINSVKCRNYAVKIEGNELSVGRDPNHAL